MSPGIDYGLYLTVSEHGWMNNPARVIIAEAICLSAKICEICGTSLMTQY